MPLFIPGLKLNRLFYTEVVRPLLDRHFPGLIHSAGLMGYGSDVLGLDTAISADHNWGPRLQIFLAPEDHPRQAENLNQTLSQVLPPSFRGHAVNFSPPDLADGGTQRMQPVETGPVRHLIEIETVPAYFRRYLGIDLAAELTALDWLLIPQQKLLEISAGEVFHDGLGTLIPARRRFAAYPRDVWLARLAAQWERIAQEEPFVGRCGHTGDDLGSRTVAARQARNLMHLAFLLERRYPPYSKWLGTAFARLDCAPQLQPLLEKALQARDWQVREAKLNQAAVILARLQNDLQIGDPVQPTLSNFFGRPYQVLFAGRFAGAARAAIQDDALKRLPATIGSADQFVDCTDLSETPELMQKLRGVYL